MKRKYIEVSERNILQFSELTKGYPIELTETNTKYRVMPSCFMCCVTIIEYITFMQPILTIYNLLLHCPVNYTVSYNLLYCFSVECSCW